MNLVKIVCPNCKETTQLDNDREYGYCSFCGAKIELNESNISKTSIKTLEEYKEEGLNLINSSNFTSLKELAITMVGKWPMNFWSYCFLAIADSEINLIGEMPYNAQRLTKEEVNDDIKSRIYFAARKKYVSSTLGVFNSLSKYYPDVPASDGSDRWQKCPTGYERHQALLSKYMNAIELIRSKYLQKMKNFAQNDDEYQIISNFKKWESNVLEGKKDLDNYNKTAQNFVNEDYKNTPKPGNKILFSIFLSLFSFSTALFVVSVLGLIYGCLFGFLSEFTKVFFVISSCFMVGMTTYFILSKKLFYSKKVISSVILVLLVVMVIALGANGVFFARADNGYVIFFYIMSILLSLISGTTSFIIFVKNRIRKTTINKTYIGDLTSLAKNNFDVHFTYEFK